MEYSVQRERRTSIQMLEHTVLANNSAKPALYGYRGLDDEDFNLFKNVIQDYIAIKNITSEKAKIAILRAKLVGKARQDFESSYPKIDESSLKCDGALDDMKPQFNTEEVVERKRNMFYNIQQLPSESPHNFENRVYKAADNAGITDESFVQYHFKFGLLPEIRNHCISLGAVKTEEFAKYAQGYWNTHFKTVIPYNNEDASLSTQLVYNNYYPGTCPVVRELNLQNSYSENFNLNDNAKNYLNKEIKNILHSDEVQNTLKNTIQDAVNKALSPSDYSN